jgi:hypothetical protein
MTELAGPDTVIESVHSVMDELRHRLVTEDRRFI